MQGGSRVDAQATASPLPAIDNLEERVRALLHRATRAAARRDSVLSDVVAIVDAAAQSSLRARAATLSRVHDDVLPSCAERTAALARVVQCSAAVAARASRRVRCQSLLLQRAEAAQQRVTSMCALRQHRAALPRALASGDVERTVDLLRAYADARDALGGAESDDDDDDDDKSNENEQEDGDDGHAHTRHDNDNDDDGNKRTAVVASADDDDGAAKTATLHDTKDNNNNNNSNNSTMGNNNHARARVRVSQVRATVQQQVEQLADDAVARGDTAEVRRATMLLARLGCVERGSTRYVAYVCDRAVAQLQQTVAAELRKMAEPATTAVMTHLALVSQTLDAVVATYESEVAFVRDHLGGNDAAIALLRALHRRATAQCVPVLTDFVAKRQDILDSVLLLPHTRRRGGRRTASDTHTTTTTDATNTHATTTANALAVEARRVDHMLEEMTHLVSCCHVYLRFLEEQEAHAAQRHEQQQQQQQEQQEQQQQQMPQGSASDATVTTTTPRHTDSNSNNSSHHHGGGGSVDHLWRRHDSPLLTAVQELLSMYVPLQSSYFGIAFAQAVQLQNAADGIAATTANDDNSGDDDDDGGHSAPHARSGSRSSSSSTAAATVRSSRSSSRSSSAGHGATRASSPRHGPLTTTSVRAGNAAAAATATAGTTAVAAAVTAPSSSSSLFSGLTNLYTAAAQRVVGGLSAASPLDGGLAAAQQLWSYGGGGGGGDADSGHAQPRSSRHHRHDDDGGGVRTTDDVLCLSPAVSNDAMGTTATAAAAAATTTTTMTGGSAAAAAAVMLPDDVFFFLRIALHRAVAMQSTQIASAVVIAVTDVLQSKLLPHVRRRASPSLATTYAVCSNSNNNNNGASVDARYAGGSAAAAVDAHAYALPSLSSPTRVSYTPPPQPSSSSSSQQQQQTSSSLHRHHAQAAHGITATRLPRPSTLRWVCAARQVIDYTEKLAGELTRLVDAAQYDTRDALRFRELAGDMRAIAATLDRDAQAWLAHYADAAFALTMPTHLARLHSAGDYTFSDDALYLCELHDVWVQACMADWQAMLTCLDAHLDATSFDVLLRAAATRTASAVFAAYVHKRYNANGALQVDKEVRALRACFLARAHERTPRDAFAALSLLSMLLLCDRPRDAQEERHNTALDADAKRAVLRCRVDFARDEIDAVPLS